MQALAVVLLFISIGTIATPVGAVLVTYRDNLSQLVITPQIQNIVNGSSNILPSNSNGNSNSNNPSMPGGLLTPVFVSDQIDQASRTFTVTANVTNSLNYDLTLNSFTATVADSQDDYQLGTISLSAPVTITAGQTSQVTVSGSWTQNAENYVSTTYPGATSIDVNLVNAAVNVNGITVESTQPINVGSVPIA